jgi:DNA-directed RNA polymerase specialized sigma24 family protein
MPGDARLDLAVAFAKRGDRSAGHYLYVRLADQVHGYVKAMVRDPHQAEALTENVFTTMIAEIGRYEHRMPFADWLLGLARDIGLATSHQARATTRIRRA